MNPVGLERISIRPGAGGPTWPDIHYSLVHKTTHCSKLGLVRNRTSSDQHPWIWIFYAIREGSDVTGRTSRTSKCKGSIEVRREGFEATEVGLRHRSATSRTRTGRSLHLISNGYIFGRSDLGRISVIQLFGRNGLTRVPDTGLFPVFLVIRNEDERHTSKFYVFRF